MSKVDNDEYWRTTIWKFHLADSIILSFVKEYYPDSKKKSKKFFVDKLNIISEKYRKMISDAGGWSIGGEYAESGIDIRKYRSLSYVQALLYYFQDKAEPISPEFEFSVNGRTGYCLERLYLKSIKKVIEALNLINITPRECGCDDCDVTNNHGYLDEEHYNIGYPDRILYNEEGTEVSLRSFMKRESIPLRDLENIMTGNHIVYSPHKDFIKTILGDLCGIPLCGKCWDRHNSFIMEGKWP